MVPICQTKAVDSQNKIEKILIVDDEPMLREGLARQLARQGYSVETAESGNKALDWIHENPTKLVITDIQMPDGDGIELLKRIKVIPRNINVILMTGYSKEPPELAFNLGARKILKKPFNLDDLAEAIDAALATTQSWPIVSDIDEPCNLKLTFTEGLEELLAAKKIILGSGGFAVQASEVFLPNDKNISFELSFNSNSKHSLIGCGQIKWNHSQKIDEKNQYVGIEITALSENSQALLSTHIKNLKPSSYIPLY